MNTENTATIIEAANDENASTAEKTEKPDASNTYIHRFTNPFEYEGKKYTAINFYFGSLTGGDMLKIESEMQANNEYALDPLLSRNFLSKMASKASGIPSDALEAMPLKDFNRITGAARNFLINSEF